MSYSILYNKVFIKSNNGYTVVALVGDNNVYETTKRRARDWSIWHFSENEEEILNHYKKWSYQDELLKTHNPNKWVNTSQFIKMIKRGLKNAISVEELIALNRLGWINSSVMITNNAYGYDSPKRHSFDLRSSIRTTEEFDRFVSTVQERKKELTEYETIQIIFDLPEDVKTSSLGNRRVLAKVGGGFYVSDISDDCIKMVKKIQNALVFESVEDAMEQLPGKKVSFEDADKAFERFNNRDFVIATYTNDIFIGYLTYVSKSNIRVSQIKDAAHRYTENEARKQIERLRPRFSATYNWKLIRLR